MIFKNAKVFNGTEFIDNEFAVSGGKFVSVQNDVSENGDVIDLSGAYVIPGLVDIHTHGNSGEDFSDGNYDGLKKMSSFYASKGVTSFCPTSLTLSYDTLSKAFSNALALSKDDSCSSRIAGIHMEGPYFSEKKKGAQNAEYLKKPDYDGFKKLYDACDGFISIVDIAPELDGAATFTEKASKLCTVSIAHTDCSYEDAEKVIEAGANHLTHLYNAMPSIHHRDPGPIGAGAEDKNVYAELICDGYHIHESAIRIAFKLFPNRICLISDSLRCAGMPDGEYELGGLPVFLKGGVARLAEGNIAGSAANLYDCMLNAIRFGIDVKDAINAATINPARSIGWDDKIGSIEVGKFADFVVTDKTLKNIKSVYIGGELKKS